MGTVLNIQRFCTEDGPGIRTTVFLKGCPLRCLWCHNPESQHGRPELLYDAEKCVNCGRCTLKCPEGCHTILQGEHTFDRERCLACGTCISPLCDALELSGEEMTADAVLTEVLKDRLFYENSGGGMTLSGGEPLFRSTFASELLEKAKAQGLHTCVETCGFADSETIEKTAEWIDLYLFDWKESDPLRHKEYTGVDQGRILESLRLLDSMGKEIVLRCPVIPTLNDRADHFRGIAELANTLRHLSEVQIEPYHTLGAQKYVRLGKEYTLREIEAPTAETVDDWIREIRKYTAATVRKA